MLAGSGCQPEDELGFRVTNIEFDDDATITLTFSEPLADFDGINPNDFRLSVGLTSSYSYTYEGMSATYEYTSYNDLAYFSNDYYYTGLVIFTALTEGSAANEIVLEASQTIAPVCDNLANQIELFEMYFGESPGSRFDAAIFLHYASGEIPIESTSGSVLGDIGADWVLSMEAESSREGFGFTKLSPQLRIPCP